MSFTESALMCGETVLQTGNITEQKNPTLVFVHYKPLLPNDSKEYHGLVHREISDKSLPALAVFMNPLDLRLRLFLCNECAQHAWLARFVLAYSHRQTEMDFHPLCKALISRQACAELRRTAASGHTSSLLSLILCCQTKLTLFGS